MKPPLPASLEAAEPAAIAAQRALMQAVLMNVDQFMPDDVAQVSYRGLLDPVAILLKGSLKSGSHTTSQLLDK